MVIAIKNLFPLIMVFSWSSAAPAKSKTEVEQPRESKSMPYFDFYHPDELDFNNYDSDTDDYVPMSVEENELSRTIPTKKRYSRPPPPQFNSPIYYIRLPPQPYMFVPGLGYVSQPAQHPMGQFLNVPVSFLANGKPSTIYQWSGGADRFPGMPEPMPGMSEPIPTLPPKPKPQPPKPTESTIHRLPGHFVFNGKPEDIYVLRDSYNSLYSDALQNFYP